MWCLSVSQKPVTVLKNGRSSCLLSFCALNKEDGRAFGLTVVQEREITWVVVLGALTAKADHAIIMAVTQSMDDVKQEKATKEPLAPGSPPGSDSEQATTTDGSHVGWIPGVFPDIEDHLNQLQTPLPTSKNYKSEVFSFIHHLVVILDSGNSQNTCVLTIIVKYYHIISFLVFGGFFCLFLFLITTIL